MGSEKLKTDPCPGSLVTHSLPPCASTMPFAISPAPCVYRVLTTSINAAMTRLSATAKVTVGIHPSAKVEGRRRMPSKPNMEMNRNNKALTSLGVGPLLMAYGHPECGGSHQSGLSFLSQSIHPGVCHVLLVP
jgi:hypothetical protein